MRALSIRQPWAWAILYAGKRVENRDWTWAPTWRETFLIHASAGCTRDEYASGAMFLLDGGLAGCEGTIRETMPGRPTLPTLAKLTRGAVVGRARLTQTHRGETAYPWAIPDALHLVLADVERIVSPIPLKGALGFFEVPDAMLAGAMWEACS